MHLIFVIGIYLCTNPSLYAIPYSSSVSWRKRILTEEQHPQTGGGGVMEYETNCSCNLCRLNVSQKKVSSLRMPPFRVNVDSETYNFRRKNVSTLPPTFFHSPYPLCLSYTFSKAAYFFIRVICFIPRQMPGRPYFRAISQTLKVYIFIFTSDAYLAGCFSYFFWGFFICIFHLFFGCTVIQFATKYRAVFVGYSHSSFASPPPSSFLDPPCSYSRQ